MKDIIKKLILGEDLTSEEAEEAMKTIMSGEASDAQIAAFLVILRMKGETIDEIAASTKVLRDFATKVNPKVSGPVVDTCGAGGDLLDTFNVSTTAAFIVAGAGVPVAKHGNRSVSSKSGSADVLEELGVNIELGPKGVEKCIEKAGIGFMYARTFHGAMKNVASTRKDLGVRTIFNILGPLISPAEVEHQIYGIFDPELTEKLAGVLKETGSKHAMVVHGMDGLDEFSILGETKVSELKDGKIKNYMVKPEDFGLKSAKAEEIKGGTPKENAKITLDILKGDAGPKADIAILNAGAAIYIGGKAKNIKEGVRMAQESIESGAALNALNKLIEVSNA